jgi:hypothetical protein
VNVEEGAKDEKNVEKVEAIKNADCFKVHPLLYSSTGNINVHAMAYSHR